jgi:hypothetical protein
MKDKNWTLSDLKFIAKKNEFWGTVAFVLALGVALGLIIG